jgi:hypothetical protein
MLIGTTLNGTEAIVEQDAVGRLATVRLRRSSRCNAPVIDLPFASSGIGREIVAQVYLGTQPGGMQRQPRWSLYSDRGP